MDCENINPNVNRSNGKGKILKCGDIDNDRSNRNGINEKAKEARRVRSCILREKTLSPRNTK